MGKKSKSQKHKILLPPDLPPDIADEEIQVSDEDLQFVNENQDYAGFVSRLDTQSITKHVTRVADVKEDALEALYEKRLKKKKAMQIDTEQTKHPVDHVDALPVKTLEGKLYYRKLTNVSEMKQSGQNEEEAGENGAADNSIGKLTKAERRAKLKKSKKELKKQGKESDKIEVVQQTPQASVLAEVEENLTAEEAFEDKKRKLAELGSTLLADPESNIKSLREMLQLIKDTNHTIVKLGLLSLLTVFKDIIPGYRIRLPTEKELEMKVSKDVKRMRFYESTLLSCYKVYLQKLVSLEKDSSFRLVAARCVCDLVEAVPHFNFQESLLNIVVRNIGSPDDVIRKLSCDAIKLLFTNEGKHGGEATVDAVRLIAAQVKVHDCQLHPDSIETFLSLSFDEDLGGPEKKDEDREKTRKGKKGKRFDARSQSEDERKNSTKEMRMRIGEEVAADYRAASFAPDLIRRKQIQSDTLSALFETYFRILKNTMLSITMGSGANRGLSAGGSRSHPLLAPCLKGLGKFSHFIDLDFLSDLLNYLRRLASSGDKSGESSEKISNSLSICERLQCCIVAFKVVKKNLGALNIDLHDFFVQLYNLVLEYRPGRDQGEVLAEALKVMLCEDRQHDMQKAAAFVKRLASFSLCFGSEEAMAALVTLKHLLQKNVKCRNLLENDVGGGSVSGSIAKYQPNAYDPNLSGALASVLWELDLLSRHYHPSVSKMASSISSMNSANNQVYVSTLSPLQAFTESSLEQETFNRQIDIRKGNKKRKRSSESSSLGSNPCVVDVGITNEDDVRKKLGNHFVLLRDIKENERLRSELQRTTLSLQLYEEYRKQLKKKGKQNLQQI